MATQPTYKEVESDKVPGGMRWDVPPQHAGQIIETAFADKSNGRTQGGFGDLYQRVTDQSLATDHPDRVKYFRRVGPRYPG